MNVDVKARQDETDWEQPSDLYWDPFDYRFHADAAHPVWKRMRDEAPIYRNEKYDFWALSRFQDVVDTYVDWQTYSSEPGDILETIRSTGGNDYSLPNMINEDPPLQHLHRALVSRAFTPRAVQAIGERVRGNATRLLDEMVPTGRLDMVRDLGAHVAGSAILGMLGVPDSDLKTVLDLTDGTMHTDEDDPYAVTGFTDTQARYYLEQVKRRREDPTDDMLSVLATIDFTDENGVTRRLNDAEVAGYTVLLTGGGYETVARFSGWSGVALAEFPEQRAKLVERPDLITNAVDELLRYNSPSHANARTTKEDVEWYGRTIPKGSVMVLLPGSAGRDEREFPDPDVLDVEREFTRHLAFGFGIHFCMGAALARLEGRIILEELTKRIPEWDVDWDGAEVIHAGSKVRGYAKLPITF
jgi:cytochrome P450